jgi:archaellum component FlaG (FlaF/FlaG flagellin family)
MVKRQTWVLLAVFAVLIGLAFGWTRYQNDRKKSQPTPIATPEQFLFTLDSATVASMKITDNVSSKVVTVARDISGQWILVEPKAEYTDVANVEAAVTQLASLRVLTALDSTDNLAEYGLDKPAYTITVIINGGQQFIAQVGSTTVTSSGYYVLIPGGVPQIVAKYGLDAVLKLWLNPPIATPPVAPTLPGTVAPTVVTTVTLEAPSSTPSPLPASTNTPPPTGTLVPTSTPVPTGTPVPAFTATVAPDPSTPTSEATTTPAAATPTETEKP